MNDIGGFRVAVEVVAGKLRVSATGELDLTGELPLVEAIESGLENHVPCGVVVDLAEVEFMDSSGLRGLLRAQRATEKAGVPFALTGLNEAVSRILDLSGVTSRFRYE